MARAVKKIVIEEAHPLLRKLNNKKGASQIKVCAYVRVSSNDPEQISSYKSQIQYYSSYICDHANWSFVGIFTDDGITGTNTINRSGFNRMIKMCKKGEIDLIITKSVSRFARNTVDSLKTCRELKKKGVGVIFEKENINTLNEDIEVHLAIASSMAQEESRSISENVKWGFKRKFEQGGIMIVTSRFMGYDMDEDGNLIINEEQADVVRKIFTMFLEGYTYNQIAKHLSSEGIKTVTGKEQWKGTVIK